MSPDQALEEFERLCREGKRPELSEFLLVCPIDRNDQLELKQELACIDLEYRWRDAHTQLPQETALNSAGDTSLAGIPDRPLADHYFNLWPELANSEGYLKELIAEEYRSRCRWGDHPEIKEYLDRYRNVPHIEHTLKKVQSELELESPRFISDTLLDNSSDSEFPAHNFQPRDFGRYHLESKLGVGGMGEVYLALDTLLDRRVALKMPHFSHNSDLVSKRFINEAKAAALLQHPLICPIYDAGEIEGQPFLTMAYIDGFTLQNFWSSEVLPDLSESIPLLSSIARTMQVAHDQGIVHRDLKPSNVMINQAGQPIVMDFGLAFRSTALADERITLSGETIGSPAFMSPEQVEGRLDQIDHRSDIYSLGVMLYSALTGKLPFTGPMGMVMAAITRDEPQPPSKLNQAIPEELEQLCLRMLAKDPQARPATMLEVAEKLEALDLTPTSALNTNTQIPPNSNSGWWVAMSLLPLALLLGFIFFRIQTPEGEIEIQVAEEYADQISVRVLEHGKLVKVANRESGWSLQLEEGDYEIELGSGRENFKIEPKWVTVERLNSPIVVVKRVVKEPDLVSRSNNSEPQTTLPEDWLGTYRIDWLEQDTQYHGTIDYTFLPDHTVLKGTREYGTWRNIDGVIRLTYFDADRGTVLATISEQGVLEGTHTWADGSLTDWKGHRIQVDEVSTSDSHNSTLVTSESADSEWKSLFNGKDLSGWQPMLTSGDNRENREESTTGWAVHDGVLICTSDEDGFLIHEGTYSDFELQLEFKLVPNGNSGVYFRAELEGNAARAGMEAQIIDSNYEHPRIPNYQLTDDTRTGSIYAVTGPGKSPLNKLGEWNSLTLRAVGDEVQVSVNGIQTAQANMSLNESLKSRPRSGRIYLSNWKGEANEMAFRAIRIRELNLPNVVEIEKKLPEKNLALYFDGVDDNVVTPIKYDGSHPITIEIWMAPVHPWINRMIIGNCWGDNGLRINHATNGRNQPMWECEILQSSFTPSPHHYIHATPGSIRTHLAYVWDGQESRFYINGDASDPKLHAPLVEFPDGEMSFHIGVPPSEKKSDYWRFHGYVDEIRFSNVARYDSTFIPPERHRSDNETIALYHCDDEAANLILKDASGNGNDAEIFGATRKPNYEMHMPSDYYSHLNEYEQATHKVMPTRKGPALRFTTSGAKVEIPAVDFDFAEPFTAEFWGTPESEWHSRYEWGRIGYRLGKTNIRLSFPEYRWRLRVWNGPAVNNEVSRTHTARLDTRIHFAMQWNGEHLELFINGHPVPGPEITDAASFPSLKDWLTVTLKLANGESSFLGSWEGDAQFGGEIDSFRLSRGARYQQADQPEEQPVPFKPQELIVDEQTLILYDFHEGEGNVLHDLSGNDYHGTITPETIWVPAPPEVKMLPGLVAEPPDEENILRTQVITRWPQAEPCHHTFSPDGKLYAIGSRDGFVRLFEGGPEGELKSVIHIRKPDNYGAFGMHWAADSQMFFTATYNWIQIWSINGQLLHEWQHKLTDIEWHPAENILGGADRSNAYLWTPEGKEVLKVETWGSDRGSRFVWSPEGDRFLTVNGKVVLLWSRAGEMIKQIPIDISVFECEWSPDGERIVIITDDKQVVMMSPAGELLKRSQFESYGPLDVCWAPDSQSFAVSDRDYVSVWDRKANRVTRYQSVQFKSTYNCFCFSPNGQQHLILKIDKSIRIHNANSGQLIKRLHEEIPLLTSVDWIQNKKLLMVANHTHEYPVGLFNEEGTRQTEFIILNKSGYDAAWNTATDEVVLGADWELWRINTGNSENQRLGSAEKLNRAEFGYRRIAVHPEGTFIAGTGMNNPVRILNSKGELIKELKLGREIFSMKFSPDGQWLAINTSGAGITIYDTAAWNKYSEIKESSMYGVDWSSDSSKIITMISRGSIKIFNLEGLLQQEFEPDWRVGRDQSYTALSWSPDDRWIVSSRDIDVQAYNLETKERRQFPLHNGIVRDAVWISPAEFVSAADDGTLSCWDVESGKRRWITVTLWNRQNELKTVTLSATGEVLQIDPGAETMLVDLTETETGQFKIAPFKSPSSQIVE